MSKELIVRLREAAAQRVASTAMIGADDLSVAADVLEQTEAARMAAISRLCEAEVARATACQERDALAAELKAVRGDQTPTVEDINLQEWKGMDGACAWHLIDRHAEDWHHTARLMNAWLEANREDLVAQVAQLSAAMRDASEFAYQAQKELKALREQGPVAQIDDDENFQGPCRQCKELWLTAGSVDVREFVRAIEAAMRGEGE